MCVTPGAYDRLREDARQVVEVLGLAAGGRLTPARDARDEEIAAKRAEIARLRVLVTRVIEIPREPEPQPDDEQGRAYTRGWQDVRALIDKALDLEGLDDEEQG